MPLSIEEKRVKLKRELLKRKLAEKNSRPEPKEENLFKSGYEAVSDAISSAENAIPLTDEIAGFGGATLDEIFRLNQDKSWIENYRKHRDKSRLDQAEKERRSPIASKVGLLAGALLMPNPAKGAGLLGKAATAAGEGALYGFGSSTADLTKGALPEAAYDTAIGAGIGGALPLVGKVASKVPAATKWAGKKALRVAGGVGEETADRYVKRQAKVNASRDLPELVDEIQENLGTLKNEAVEGSQKALELIPEDRRLSINKIRDIFSDVIEKNQKSATPEKKRVAKYLGEVMENIEENAAGSKGPKGSVPFRDLKDTIKEFDDVTTYGGMAGSFDKAANSAKKSVRSKMDKLLKDEFPEYKKAMKEVADKFSTLNESSKQFGKSKSAVASKLKSMAYKPKDRITETSALKRLDDVLGTDITEENADRLVREAFEKTHQNGSRNTLMGALAGMGIGGMIDGGAVSGTLGAIAGYLSDKYGPKVSKKILDMYIKSKGGMQKLGQMPLMQKAAGFSKEANYPYAGVTGLLSD